MVTFYEALLSLAREKLTESRDEVIHCVVHLEVPRLSVVSNISFALGIMDALLSKRKEET